MTTRTSSTSRSPSPGPAPADAGAPGGGAPPPGGGGGGGGGGPPAGPPAGVPAAPAPHVIQFARTPGDLDADNLIDYSTKEGRATFKAAIASLGEEKFDAKSGGINGFHEKLMRRAKECGWNQGRGDIITVNGINSIVHYGRVTTDQIRTEATAYVDNSSRQTQNNSQMYRAIMNSLTEECSSKIINRPSEYTISIGNTEYISAILLHKSLMQRAIVDTRSTSSNFRTCLSSLDTYMPVVNSNIEKFNSYVSNCIQGLEARGETSEDLLDNLFKGYKVASDRTFVQYIEMKETEYFDGADIVPDKLMRLAENKYASLVERGLWGGQSAEQKQIIALTTTISKLQNSMKIKKPPKADAGNNKEKGKGKNKSDKAKNKNRNNDEKWAWKTVPPSNGETTKKFGGKDYHWCPHHEAWTLHTPAKCTKGGGSAAPQSSENRQNNNVSFAASVNFIMNELEEDL